MTTEAHHLIFGGSGFIGSHILREMQSRGWSVTGTRASSASESLAPFDLRTQRLTALLETLDLAPDAPIVAVVCSSICQIDRCFRERDLSYRINVERTITLLHDLAQRNARVVFLSTSHVFDGQTGNSTEDTPVNPLSEYGRQKLIIEQFLAQNNPSALVMRLDKIVGQDPGESHLFSEWKRWREDQKPLRCIQDQILSPTLVEDVAKAMLLGIEHDLHGVYHAANSEAFSRADLARLFLEVTQDASQITEEPLENFPFADARPLNTTLDSSRFDQATGMKWTPMRTALKHFSQMCAPSAKTGDS